LYDDAAIFPPGNAPLDEAVRAHRAWRSSSEAATVGPFVCTAARLDELAALGADFPVSVTVPDGPAGLADVLARDDLDIVSVEVPFSGDGWDALVGAAGRTTVYVEVPLADLTTGFAQRLADSGIRLKLRTGGADPSMFPTAAALAAGIVTAVRAGLPFKLTAGLHNALRHRDPETGFEHHGFGNVLAATVAAQRGAGVDEVAAILDTTDPAVVTDLLGGLSEPEAAAVRGAFLSFGTCSIEEPLDDLAALGLRRAPTGADA
jgi:hypothetical protein